LTRRQKVYSETSRIEIMSRYVALIGKTGTGFSAHVPDLPGCIAAAATYGETVKLIHEAISFHIEGMMMHGEHVPEPTTLAELVEVA
jgi:predicted RNase H-like HicB family nuclease